MSVKILHVLGRMNKGGAELRTLEIMQETISKGYHQDFCVLSGLKGELDDVITNAGGEILYLPIHSIKFPFLFYKSIKKEKYSIIHSHVHHTSGYILFIAKLAGVKGRIAHFRSTGKYFEKISLFSRIIKIIKKALINRYATSILAVSENTMQYAWSTIWKNDNRCEIIYNGIIQETRNKEIDKKNFNEEFQLNDNNNIYINVGRFDEPKNHKKCIQIFRQIFFLDPTAILILAGKGGTKEEAYVKEYVIQNNLSNNVFFLGIRSDIAKLLNSSNILLFPSKWEGLPGAVLEASAYGIPVLGSNIPSIVEISEKLSNVKYLDLKESDSVWAAKAIDIVTHTRLVLENKKTRNKFKESPFTISSAVANFCYQWDKYKI